MKEIKFLIIGLTGAYGSGCTTLAQAICSRKLNQYIKEENLIEEVNEKRKELYESLKHEEDPVKIKDYNYQINQMLLKRKYLSEIIKFQEPDFQYISMSTILVKAALSFIDSPAFILFKVNNAEVCEKMVSFNNIWKETLQQFNNQGDDYIKVDELLVGLEKLKNDIKDVECKNTQNNNESLLQFLGDNFRKYGNPFGGSGNSSYSNLDCLAKETKHLIKYYKNRTDCKKKSCFIIDAFRNPMEVEYFRKRYTQFFLISLYANKNTRSERLMMKYGKNGDTEFSKWFDKIDKRDYGEENDAIDLHCQNVSRCCYLSDIAIDNNITYRKYNINKQLVIKLLRYYALLISPGCIPPTKEETFMDLAYSLSLRSTCISRQVGAVITDIKGYIIGMGWNDVAHTQIGCGYMNIDDYISNSTHFTDLIKNSPETQIDDIILSNNHFAFCYKDALSQKKINEKIEKIDFHSIFEKFLTEDLITLFEERMKKALKDKIKESISIKRLEYCRSLHAEENALLQVASRGGVGVDGGTIYTSTFPCELCAKKIYQSGIKEVYYTEPYPNSISESVFLKDGINKIKLIHFEGVKSFGYYRLYKPHIDLKESQRIESQNGCL